MGSTCKTETRQRSPILAIPGPEWDALLRGRCNLLVVGARSATDACLRILAPHLRAPLCSWAGEPDLPLSQADGGTLVLSGVDRCDAIQQAQLFEWLHRLDRRTQVISMTEQSLFSLVERGAFRADLYYRLNLIRIEMPSRIVSKPIE